MMPREYTSSGGEADRRFNSGCTACILCAMLQGDPILISLSPRAVLQSVLFACLQAWAIWSVAFADDSQQPLSIALLAAETRFDSNTMALSPDGEQALQDLLQQLEEYEEILSIRIIGHTDNVGSNEFNQQLSLRRANAIRENFLGQFGEAHLIAVGVGESQPIASNQTEAGRERNRRVEIQVIARGYSPEVDSNAATNN